MSSFKTTMNTQPTQLAIRARGITRRVIPELQAEIGEDPADLLLQMDHWVASEGTNGAITLTARQIKNRAFPTWPLIRVRRTLYSLRDQGLLTVTYSHDNTPTYRLNLEAISRLKSVSVPSTHSDPTLYSQRADPLLRVSRPSTQGEQTSPDLSSYIEIKKEPRTSDQSVCVGNPDLPGPQKDGEPTPSTHSDQPSTHPLIKELADLCALDLGIPSNAQRTEAHAQELARAGYTADDLKDLAWFWHNVDFRGKKNGNLPFLSQIAELLKQALEHPKIKRRRELRAQGTATSDNPLIAGYEDIIHY